MMQFSRREILGLSGFGLGRLVVADLNGKIGGETGGKWYGGVYGWGFSVTVPQTGKLAHRNTHYLGLTGFLNAYTLTGDDRYLDVWRKQIDTINRQSKTVNGRTLYPRMYGDDGWYSFTPQKYDSGAFEIWYLSMRNDDLGRLSNGGWVGYLHGKNPRYPEQALRADLERIRGRVAGMRADKTTPDTRLADDPMKYNPASVQSLIQLMLGGIHPGHKGSILHCRLRYFDPQNRRAGVPDDIAVLVESLTADSTGTTLVNTSQTKAKTVVVQAGGYAEHRFETVSINGKTVRVDGTDFEVRLNPGCGARLQLGMKRFVNQPTMAFPWDR